MVVNHGGADGHVRKHTLLGNKWRNRINGITSKTNLRLDRSNEFLQCYRII